MADLGRDPLELARRHFAAREVAAYVVGGRVRDVFLGRSTWDTDLVVPGDALAHARTLAERGGGAFVPLDAERGIARVVWPARDGRAPVLDVADMVGTDLAADLAARDFTVNAMAVPLDGDWPPVRAAVIDPGGGLSDLDERTLRMSSAEALESDPLRLLRAVRLAAELGFVIEPVTQAAIEARASLVRRPAAERRRDELLRVVQAPDTAGAVRLMSDLDLLQYSMPELDACRTGAGGAAGRDGTRSGDCGAGAEANHEPTGAPTHEPRPEPSRRGTRDVFEHSLAVAGAMETLLRTVYASDRDGTESDGEVAGPAVGARHEATAGPARQEPVLLPPSFESVLAEFSQRLQTHLWRRSMGGYARAVYLELAALLHDVGKPASRAADDAGRPHVPHGEMGAARVAALAAGLRFGASESAYVATVVRLHPRPLAMARGDGATREAIYRFFADSGPAGVDVALLALADNAVKPHHSAALIEGIATVVESLLHAWFEEPEVAVDPVPLLAGTALMDALDLVPGPEVGRLLAAVREAQAVGAVTDRAGALALASSLHAPDHG